MTIGPHLERLLANAVTKFKHLEQLPGTELPYLYFDAVDEAIAEMPEEDLKLVLNDLWSAPSLQRSECEDIVPHSHPTASEIFRRTIESQIRTLMLEIPELAEENQRRREAWLKKSA